MTSTLRRLALMSICLLLLVLPMVGAAAAQDDPCYPVPTEECTTDTGVLPDTVKPPTDGGPVQAAGQGPALVQSQTALAQTGLAAATLGLIAMFTLGAGVALLRLGRRS